MTAFVRRASVVLAATLFASSLRAMACPPPPAEAADLGARWISAGVSHLRSGDYVCAQGDFAQAAAFIRKNLREEPWLGPYDLSFALSQEGVALSYLGQRKRAAQIWRQTAHVLSSEQLVGQTPKEHADNLFERHQYKSAFRAYHDVIFFQRDASTLTPTEYDNGAAVAIRKALALAASGKYASALSTVRTARPSQAARYLEGQLASLAGNYKLAYAAYVDELQAYLLLPAEPGAAAYGTMWDRPTMRRLVELTNL